MFQMNIPAETLAWVLIWEYTQQELSNEYQHDRV